MPPLLLVPLPLLVDGWYGTSAAPKPLLVRRTPGKACDGDAAGGDVVGEVDSPGVGPLGVVDFGGDVGVGAALDDRRFGTLRTTGRAGPSAAGASTVGTKRAEARFGGATLVAGPEDPALPPTLARGFSSRRPGLALPSSLDDDDDDDVVVAAAAAAVVEEDVVAVA